MNVIDIVVLAIILIAALYIVYIICDTIVKVKKIEYDYMNKRFFGVITDEKDNESVSGVED